MMIELANDGSADGGSAPPEASGELLEQALHDSPGKVGDGDLSDSPAGRAIPQAGGRPDSRCGLEPFRRGDDLRARERRGPVGLGPAPSRGGPLDDLFIRVGRVVSLAALGLVIAWPPLTRLRHRAGWSIAESSGFLCGTDRSLVGSRNLPVPHFSSWRRRLFVTALANPDPEPNSIRSAS